MAKTLTQTNGYMNTIVVLAQAERDFRVASKLGPASMKPEGVINLILKKIDKLGH